MNMPLDLRPTSPSLQDVSRQRMDGEAHLRFSAPGQLADLYQRAPCRFLFPDVAIGEPMQAVAITTSGGLTGGDRIRLAISVDARARAGVVTQAAEKFYRALPDAAPALVETMIDVGEDAAFEWLGQEAILFDRSQVRRHLHLNVALGARVIAAESLVFGRTAMGESYRSGFIHDSWRIRWGGRLIWADALHLSGDAAQEMARPFAFGGALSLATIAYVGADARQHLDLARTLIGPARGGATTFENLLVARILGADATVVRDGVMRVIAGLRAAALGFAEQAPLLWRC